MPCAMSKKRAHNQITKVTFWEHLPGSSGRQVTFDPNVVQKTRKRNEAGSGGGGDIIVDSDDEDY